MQSNMNSAQPPVSVVEITSSFISLSRDFVSPAGKSDQINSKTNQYSPAATVAETPSASGGNTTSPPIVQVTRLEQSPLTLAPQIPQAQPCGSPTSPTNIPSSKPFDEAVNASNGSFEAVWASAEENEDRMYLFSRMMMNETPSTEPKKELHVGRPPALPFVSPAPTGAKPRNELGERLYQLQQSSALAAIQDEHVDTPSRHSSNDVSSVSTLDDASDVADKLMESPDLITLMPTSPNEIHDSAGHCLQPHVLFDEQSNKENIPPNKENELTRTPENEPGKLIPTRYCGRKQTISPKNLIEDLPWDCLDEYAAYYEGEIEQLKKMEMQRLRDLEVGMDNGPRRLLLQQVFKKNPEKYQEKCKQHSDKRRVRETFKSMRKLSSIHPPEVIEIELKKSNKRRHKQEAFEDEPLAALNLANGDTSYGGMDRSQEDPPRFPLANSPTKQKKRDVCYERKDIRNWIRKAFLCTIFAALAASAVLVALFVSGSLSKEEESIPVVDWHEGPEGELEPINDEKTEVPVYISDSNLFEGDEIVACTNAQRLEEMHRAYFGSTWKSFWDGRINTCGDQMSIGYSIWYSFNTDTSKLVEASTCNNADFDTQITVLSGNCSAFNCVSFNDQACGSRSAVTWYAEANVTYYLVISGYREASGTFGLTLSDAYNNDDCFDAMGPIRPGSVVPGTTSGASSEDMPPPCGDVDLTAPGVWYEITNVTGFIRAEVLRGYTEFYGQVSVYRSMDELDMGCGALICDSSSPTGNVTWLAEGKETYYIYVNGVNGTAGVFELFLGPNFPSTCREATKLDTNTIGYLASTERSNPQNVESCGFTGYHTAPGLWFFVEGTGKIMEVSTCGSSQTLDTQISVFADGCDSLRCIGGTGQDFPCGANGSISWKTDPGHVYHIFVSGRSSRVGEFVLSINEVEKENGDSCQTSFAMDLGRMSYQSSTIKASSSAVQLCEGTGAVRGIWHEVLGTGNTMRISVCNDDTDFDARVSLYHGSCDDLICADNTRNRCGENDEILMTTHTGQKYYVFVHGPDSYTVGNYRLDIDESVINDSCAAAPTLELSPSRYFGSTSSARLSTASECGNSNTDSVALWYRMLGTGETAILSTCSEITNFSSEITVFTGSCSSLSCIKTGGVACGNQTSVSLQTKLDEVYFVRIGGNSTSSKGHFVMDVTNKSPFFGTN